MPRVEPPLARSQCHYALCLDRRIEVVQRAKAEPTSYNRVCSAITFKLWMLVISRAGNPQPSLPSSRESSGQLPAP